MNLTELLISKFSKNLFPLQIKFSIFMIFLLISCYFNSSVNANTMPFKTSTCAYDKNTNSCSGNCHINDTASSEQKATRNEMFCSGKAPNSCQCFYKPNPTTITFSNKQFGLDFPLPPSDNLHGIMAHAIHCYHVVHMGQMNNPMDPAEIIHTNHCNRFKESIENVIRKDGAVVSGFPRQFCNDLKVILKNSGEGDHHLSYRGLNLNSLNIVDDDEMRATKYRLAAKQASTPEQLWQLVGVNNYALLVLKEGMNMTTLDEKKYLDKWMTPLALRMAAIAVKCVNIQF